MKEGSMTAMQRLAGFVLVLGFCIIFLFKDGRSQGNLLTGKTVYVWDFATRDGEVNSLTGNFTEEFEEALIQTQQCIVIERRKHQRLFEQRQNEKGIMSLDEISNAEKESLKSLHTNIVVFGDIYDDTEAGQLRIGISVQSFEGEILTKTSVLMPRGKKLDAESRQMAMKELVQKLVSGKDPRPSSEPIVVEVENVRFELKSCKLSGGNLVCTVVITNQGEDRELHIYLPNTRIIDSDAEEYLVKAATIGASAGSAKLVSGVPVKAILTFGTVAPTTTKLALLEIGFHGSFPAAQLRNIPVNK